MWPIPSRVVVVDVEFWPVVLVVVLISQLEKMTEMMMVDTKKMQFYEQTYA
jgi:hypothetical protein